MKDVIIEWLIGVLIVVSLVISYQSYGVLKDMTTDISVLQQQVSDIQSERADIDALKKEIEEIKSVEGYRIWELDWRNEHGLNSPSE